MKNTATCNLTNKSSGRVVYNIKDPDCNVRRVIYPGQTIPNVQLKELQKLIQQPGGDTLFYHFLMVDDEEILRELLNGGSEAKEYWLTERQIPSWINSCSLEEFQDALDFAPMGTKDLIKQYSVSVPLRDYDKRQAVLEQLGFDVTAAIELAKSDEDKAGEVKKVTPVTSSGRRSSTTTIIKPKKEG